MSTVFQKPPDDDSGKRLSPKKTGFVRTCCWVHFLLEFILKHWQRGLRYLISMVKNGLGERSEKIDRDGGEEKGKFFVCLQGKKKGENQLPEHKKEH